MNTAAGVSTRNGAARRATSSAPSARSVTSTAAAVDAASTVTTTPGGQVAAQPHLHEADEEQQRPGRVPGDVGGPVVVGGVGDPVDVGLEEGVHVADLAGGPQVLVRVAQRPRQPAASRRPAPATAATPATRRTTPAAAGARRAGRPGRRRTASPGGRPATAGIVPGPNSFGRQSPCSGGTSWGEALRGARAATSQSSQCGGSEPHDEQDHGQSRADPRGPAANARAWSACSRP